MIDLQYALVIEATEDPTFFGSYSPDLEGFTGVGHSVEDCLYQARWEWMNRLPCSRSGSFLSRRQTPIPQLLSRTRNGSEQPEYSLL